MLIPDQKLALLYCSPTPLHVFVIFVSSVVRRVVRLLSRLAVLDASHEAAMKQAQGAADQCQKLMDENEKLTKVIIEILLCCIWNCVYVQFLQSLCFPTWVYFIMGTSTRKIHVGVGTLCQISHNLLHVPSPSRLLIRCVNTQKILTRMRVWTRWTS